MRNYYISTASYPACFPSPRISSVRKQLRRAYLNWSFGTRRRKSDSIKHNAIESTKFIFFHVFFFRLLLCCCCYQDDCVRFISHVQIKKRKLGACKNSNKIKIDFNKQTEIADSAKCCFLRTSSASRKNKKCSKTFYVQAGALKLIPSVCLLFVRLEWKVVFVYFYLWTRIITLAEIITRGCLQMTPDALKVTNEAAKYICLEWHNWLTSRTRKIF